MLKHSFIGALVLFLGVSSLAFADNECPELEGAKLQTQMEYLQRDRSVLKAGCITYAMFQLAGASDHHGLDDYTEAIKTMVGYLDFRPTEASPLSRAVSRNRASYPASDALFMIGKAAVPELIEAIASSRTSDTSRTNAISVVFSIYSREDLLEGVRVFKRAAKARESTNWESSQRLSDAARKTAGMCRGGMATACLDAFYGGGEDKKPY